MRFHCKVRVDFVIYIYSHTAVVQLVPDFTKLIDIINKFNNFFCSHSFFIEITPQKRQFFLMASVMSLNLLSRVSKAHSPNIFINIQRRKK